VGRILGPLVAGLLFERVAPGATMGFASLISFITVVVSLNLWRMNLQAEKQPAP
jgi:hypothetical protein